MNFIPRLTSQFQENKNGSSSTFSKIPTFPGVNTTECKFGFAMKLIICLLLNIYALAMSAKVEKTVRVKLVNPSETFEIREAITESSGITLVYEILSRRPLRWKRLWKQTSLCNLAARTEKRSMFALFRKLLNLSEVDCPIKKQTATVLSEGFATNYTTYDSVPALSDYDYEIRLGLKYPDDQFSKILNVAIEEVTHNKEIIDFCA